MNQPDKCDLSRELPTGYEALQDSSRRKPVHQGSKVSAGELILNVTGLAARETDKAIQPGRGTSVSTSLTLQ